MVDSQFPDCQIETAEPFASGRLFLPNVECVRLTILPRTLRPREFVPILDDLIGTVLVQLDDYPDVLPIKHIEVPEESINLNPLYRYELGRLVPSLVLTTT